MLLLTALAAGVGGMLGAVTAAPAATRSQDQLVEHGTTADDASRGRRLRVRRSRVVTPVVSAAAEAEQVPPSTQPQPTPTGPWSGLPLTVMVVDGETGAPLAGAVRLLGAKYSRHTLLRIDKSVRSRVERADLHFDGTAHRVAHSYVEPDTSPSLQIDVDPPAGYMLASPGPVERHAKISRFARSLRATIPVRRVVDVDFDIRAESGHRLARQLREIEVYVGGKRYVAKTHAPHRVRVPFLRGEELYALVRTNSSWVEVRVPLVATPRMTIPVRVPRGRDASPTAGHYRGPVGSVTGCRFPIRWEGSATLDVWVRRFAGSPAAGVRVRLQARDPWVNDSKCVRDDGSARFSGLPAGEYHLTIAEPGFVTTQTVVTLEADGARTITMDEAPGVNGEIHVQNPQGLPLPFARVIVSDDYHHTGLESDGTQHLDRHTDASGRCDVRRMSPFEIGVSIRWAGTYTAEDLTPGEPLHVTTRERRYLSER